MLKYLGHSNVVKNWLTLRMDEGKEFQYGSDYLSIKLPMAGKLPKNPVVKAGEFIQVKAAGTFTPHKLHLIITPNPQLLEYGIATCPSPMVPQENTEVRPVVSFQVLKDIDMSTVNWLVRVQALE